MPRRPRRPCPAAHDPRRLSGLWSAWPWLALHLETHAARAPGNDLDGGVEVRGVEVASFDLRNLLKLLTRHLADLVGVRGAAALVDTGRLLQQHRSGRRLQNEREAAVVVDRDHDRYGNTDLHA